MSTWQGRCPLKKTPEFSQSLLGLYSCFLGGLAESQAPSSQGLYSVELFSPGPGVKAKCYFVLFSPSLFNLFSLVVPLMRHQRPVSHSCGLVLFEVIGLEVLVSET